jgi:hypothetical protein
MIAYASNILPSDSAYYTLANATLSGGVLHLLAGGSATINVNTTQLTTLTEYFKIATTMTPSSDAYEGGTFILIRAVSDSGKYFSHYCNVVTDSANLYSTEIELIAEEYTSLQVVIYSDVECTFTNWELCPELESSAATVEINGVKQSLPKLLADYNTSEITIEQSEQVVAMICCYLLADTDIQGHFTMNCYASERSTVHVRFTDNNMIELFCPLLFTINPGLTTIAIPHAFLTKLTGAHNFVVTAQVTNGYITVPIRSVLFTIDGGYLLSRLMSPGIDILDISIKKLSGETEPSEVWAAGTDNNQLIVKKRSYDPKNYNESWTGLYTFDNVTAAALEFNGYWTAGASSSVFTTEDVPWVFYVMSGTLYGQLGDGSTASLTLATDVTQVAAVRGWYFSAAFVNNDMGLIVAYIKSDGQVYYRQYTANSSGIFVWSAETLLPVTLATLPIVKVSLARTNDFRVVFSIQDTNGNTYAIFTSRYYQADSVDPLRITGAAVMAVNLAEPVYPEIVSVYNISNTETIVTFNMALSNTSFDSTQFALKDGNNASKAISAVAYYNDAHTAIKLTNATYMNVVNNMTLTYTAGSNYSSDTYLYHTNQGSRFYVPTTSITFTAEDFTPHISAFNGREHITAAPVLTTQLVAVTHPKAYNSDHITVTEVMALNLKAITYHNNTNREHITISAVLTTMLTQVGTSPI